jgi:hypothetical protein
VGVEPVMRLAESCDLHGIVGERLHVPTDKGSNAPGKVATIVAGMLTGADCIDDLDVVRHGGMALLFGGVYAPSTLGEFLRAFTHGHVRQLQAVSREFLVQLARRTPLLPGSGAVTFIDVDSLLRRVYGKQKQGAGFGHAKVGGYQVLLRGLNPLVATISTPDAAPVIAATQLRAGNAGSARGAARRGHRHHQGGPGHPTLERNRGDRGAGRLGVLLPQGDRGLPPGRGTVLDHHACGCQGPQSD